MHLLLLLPLPLLLSWTFIKRRNELASKGEMETFLANPRNNKKYQVKRNFIKRKQFAEIKE